MLFRTEFRGVKVVWLGVSEQLAGRGPNSDRLRIRSPKTAIPPRMCIVIPEKTMAAFIIRTQKWV